MPRGSQKTTFFSISDSSDSSQLGIPKRDPNFSCLLQKKSSTKLLGVSCSQKICSGSPHDIDQILLQIRSSIYHRQISRAYYIDSIIAFMFICYYQFDMCEYEVSCTLAVPDRTSRSEGANYNACILRSYLSRYCAYKT